MKTRISLTLATVLAVVPAAVTAQEASPAAAVDAGLVSQLCTAAAADQAELDACVASVEAALVQLEPDPEERSLLDQAADLVDDTLEDLRQIDVEAAFDDLVESAEDFELDAALEGAQEAVDGAIAEAQIAIQGLELPTDIDIQAALDEAVAEALAATEDIDLQAAVDDALAEALAATEDIDLQAAVDDALAEAQSAIEEADLEGVVGDAVAVLEDSVETARTVVSEAHAFVQENREAVCRGGSISVGTTVGLTVFALTGVEWLGLQAFWATERFTNATCGDVVGE